VKSLVFKYPGDPPQPAIEMNRAEFLTVCPRHPTRIYSGDTVQEFPMAEDEIWCDQCDEDPGDYVLLIGGTRAMCRKCADEFYLPHCRETS